MTEQEYELRLAEEKAQLFAQFDKIMDSVVFGLTSVVNSRDNNTGNHIRRTSECMRVFCRFLQEDPELPQFDEEFCQRMIKAAPMHDLGKLAIPDAILQKPGKFTDSEFAQMKTHAKAGARLVYEILSEMPNREFMPIAINIAHYHHEKWNGTGYPSGLAGEKIPPEARVMALVDVFDALVSARCYKSGFSFDDAFNIMEEGLGIQFDPVLGRKFLACRPAIEALYEDLLNAEMDFFAMRG